jgi:hypothetical protein
MIDYVALKAELDSDPDARGYIGMSDQAATDDLNLVRVVRIKSSVSGADAFKATVDTEFDLMAASDRMEWLAICAIDALEPQNNKPAASTVIRLFGGASETVAALQSLRQETVSRAVAIGLTPLVIGDVQNARSL